jgi:two-component system heavy metal sensor histidine kinase CusS
MFSRRADPPAAAGWRSNLGVSSIAAHIAWLYTLSAVILLSIVVALLYWVQIESMECDDIYFLIDKVQQLRLAVRQADHPILLEHEVRGQGGVYAPGQHFIFYSRILDANGRVLMQTPGAEKNLPPELFPRPLDNQEIPEEAILAKGADGRHYLVLSAWAETSGTHPERRIIQAALDDSQEKDFLAKYQRAALLLVIVGTLLSARVGVLIARSGMRPLEYIAQVAEQITASRLDRRIEPERWPRELAALAKAFDGMLNRLDDSHTRLGQFSADLAHELRTPIHALMVQTEVALTKERRPEEYRDILESNLEEYQGLTRLINELLFLARAENPKTQIQPGRHDARRALEAIREFHEPLAEDHDVSVTCQGQADIYADPILFRRAVGNLLANALRHTPRGGRIVLAAEQTDDDGALVRVSDTGCGIADKDLTKVCERMYCGSRGTARCASGTGLGLAIVKSIAELHGGTLAVESRPGQGTAVTLHFPKPLLAAAA